MCARWLLLLVLSLTSSAEIIDRVAVIVGKHAVTEGDILQEIRLSAFMNEAEPDFTADSRRKAADRLVERVLAESEMEIGKYPAPESSEVDAQLAALKKEQFKSPEAYAKALTKYGISEGELRGYVQQQVATLRFIDARFGPGVQILEEDIRTYYEGRFRREWENRSREPLPAFEEVRAEIEETLRAESVNRLLDQWLKEVKERTRIEFKPEAFQ